MAVIEPSVRLPLSASAWAFAFASATAFCSACR